MKLFKIIFAGSLALLTLTIILLSTWLYTINKDIDLRRKEGWFLPPVEYYTSAKRFIKNTHIPLKNLDFQFQKRLFRKRDPQQKLWPMDYSVWKKQRCLNHIKEDDLDQELESCIVFIPNSNEQLHFVALNFDSKVIQTFLGERATVSQNIALPPLLFAQFVGNKPMLRKAVKLDETPLFCLQAITAIEDHDFLEHQGISPTGILRAFFQNILKGRKSQGGSTITQQLVKNYFLTAERTYKRKIKEIFIALLLEYKIPKDEILNNYLNVIYMGQNGPFEIRGFSSASEHYFSKPLRKLSLNECALLAAIVNSPGGFNPFRHPDRALVRRNKVLNDMKKYNMIDNEAYSQALNKKLPNRPPSLLKEPAPYFIQTINQKLKDLNIDVSKGLRVYTTLDPLAQKSAQVAVRQGLKNLESRFKLIQSLAKDENKKLQASLISANLTTGNIVALVGGRGFNQTQYNRILNAKRQVGSIMKPIVYLTALESLDENGNEFTPLSPIDDSPFTHKFEKQAWSPKNYDKKFRGEVPLFYALKNSLNVPTAKIAVQIGASAIIDTAKRLGITAELKPYPSIALGAFELGAIEVLQAYSTIARLGKNIPLHLLERVESLKGNTLFEHQKKLTHSLSEDTTSVLVGIMKNTVENGTGRGVRSRGFLHPAAGKTGTTTGFRDAWFVGFTPHVVTLVWVGYDDNTSHKLTGASGAVPIWTQFMKSYATQYPAEDFPWPDYVRKESFSQEELAEKIQGVAKEKLPKSVELIFKN
ncbi:MAG: PBP1A family penicillin-binding protein [Bdellovibrionaceae bacterium]|jgi:penicillin-binding protein 1B|nr:PBP1A family penicillin-binding protein [Pseudobdellovibrionaceae bacterium]